MLFNDFKFKQTLSCTLLLKIIHIMVRPCGLRLAVRIVIFKQNNALYASLTLAPSTVDFLLLFSRQTKVILIISFRSIESTGVNSQQSERIENKKYMIINSVLFNSNIYFRK